MPASSTTHLLGELKELRESCLTLEKEFQPDVARTCRQAHRSAQNLLDYLALRKHDLRDLQQRLSSLGLSSLGRTESSTLAGLDAVIALVELMAGEQHPEPAPAMSPIGDAFKTGPATLARNARDLLGPAPNGRAVRIMVTMPSEAADSYELVKGLVENGTDVIRINCAHDTEREWESMVNHLHHANQELGKHCRIVMDLAGPKLRTGPILRGHHVVRWRVAKDMRGIVTAPARVALIGKALTGKPTAAEPLTPSDVELPVSEILLGSMLVGDTVRIKDSRGKTRELKVTHKAAHACLCTCDHGAYVLSRAELKVLRDGREIETGHLGELPFVEEPTRLRAHDMLVLTKDETLPPERTLPHISCTLPEVFTSARAGQPIFFDDGKIEGRIREVHNDRILVEITHAGGAPGGAKLGSGKGINLPDTDLGIGAMTDKDRRDLDFVAKHADLVGLSFVRRSDDVLELLHELGERGKSHLGIILKIECRQGFDQLPMIMIAALRHHPVGIMVARGDLAIEVGFERLAEVQEEILWLSEAAHIPVIWATQVLETFAKTGTPSRAEVTDAAMGVGAECVMLNKGEHILDAVRFLDDILHRMRAHHMKKRSLLRRLAVAEIDHPQIAAVNA